ncbi:MAG: FAD-binding protein [Proteobacteria bacterium]|nr:FAD-binding protein [Pseudomonadota bacterium]
MKIIVDPDKCTGCKICVRVCPQMILEVKDRMCHTIHEPHCATCGISQAVDIDRCMGCFGCEDECPEGAIRVIKAPAAHGDDIPYLPAPQGITECDVAVVGAGPAGLGAAIACAREGLSVVVFEKLPNRELSHHNDGGVMFTIPGATSIKVKDGKIVLKELDIELDAKIAHRLDYIGMLGPNGIETQSDYPKNLDGFVQTKTGLLRQLGELAESHGTKMWYNAKVVDILKEGDQICGVKLHTGEEIRSKVVVTADGIFAHMTEKAGFAVNREEPWYTVAMRFDFEKTTPEMKALRRGYHYVIGGMEPEDEMGKGYDSCQGSIAVTDTVHMAVGFVMKGPHYPAPKPIDFYVDKFLKTDPRIKQLFGDMLEGKKHGQLLGFRARFRAKHLEDRVGNGVVCVGDAWVDDCDLGNMPSLSNGVHTGRVIVEAIRKGDCSKAALEPANEFVTPRVLKYLHDSKKTKLSSTVLNQEEIDEWFKYLPHFNYPMIVFGGPWHQTVGLTKYLVGNAFRFFNLKKYPKLKDYVLG